MRVSRSIVPLVFALLFVLAALPAAAQVQRGTIYGTITDHTGLVLPGVTVQLKSDVTASRDTVTDSSGQYRFTDLDPGRYTVTATLAGFAPHVRANLVVGVGTNVEAPVQMAVAGVQEEVRVTAESPMLDVKQQGNIANFDVTVLNELPTARDPWALLQYVPGVQQDRINVGGSESGQQSVYSARGDDGSNTMWNLDGVTITDPSAIGSSPTYYDFNTFEEVQFTTSATDPRQQTGGLGINFVTKRGTNAYRGTARTYFTNDALQSSNVPGEFAALGFRGNGIRQIAEYGGDVGGPLLRDRLWFWGAWAKNDIRQVAITGRPDNTELKNTSAKVNSRLSAQNDFNFFFYRGEKVKIGRNAGVTRPPETTWNQTGPTSIYKFEDSHVFGPNLFLSGKFAYVAGGFSFEPQGADSPIWYDLRGGGIWHGSYYRYITDRPQYQTNVDGNYYRGRHEVKYGFQYRRTPVREYTAFPGDQSYTVVNLQALGYPDGLGWVELSRAGDARSVVNTTSFYAGDTIALGRFTVNAGLRFDRQTGENEASTSPANGLAPSILPALDFPGAKAPFTWNDVSPRVGVTFRINDRTIAKGSYSRFAEQLRSLYVSFNNPVQEAEIEYEFFDANGDHIAQASELLGPTGYSYAVNPANPTAPFSPDRVDPNLTAPITHAAIFGVERQLMPNFSFATNVGYGYITNTIWGIYQNVTRADFVQVGTAGSAGGITSTTPVYALAPGAALAPGRGILLTNRPGYHQRYWNVDFIATKRLADRWMVRGSVTLQNHNEDFDDPSQAIQDPTPRAVTTETPLLLPAAASYPGGIIVNSAGGGSGARGDVFIHSRWSYNLMALYELPWGVNAAGTLYGRQGYPNPEYVDVDRGALGNPTQVLVTADLEATRYDAVHLLDLRAQKRIPLNRVHLTFDVDLFNALNTNTILQQNRQATSDTFRQPHEIVAPRVLRFGLRVQF
jgi:hypothetical protein